MEEIELAQFKALAGERCEFVGVFCLFFKCILYFAQRPIIYDDRFCFCHKFIVEYWIFSSVSGYGPVNTFVQAIYITL